MDAISLLESFPDEAMLLFESGIVFSVALWLIIGIYHDLIVLFDNVICQKRKAAFCLGIHNGTINSVCRNHACPHARQCVHHVPRRSLRHMISLAWQRIKRHS